MRNEQLLRQLRPDLQLSLQSSKPDERFQNQTLRPILKMQHALLVQLFAMHIRKRKNVFFKLSVPARMEWITNAVRADQHFRNLLVGVVVGHFSLDELTFFETNEAACLRRLVNLIIQRLQSVNFEERIENSPF